FAGELFARRPGILPILNEENRVRRAVNVSAADGDLAELAARLFVPLLVDDPHAMPGIRPADRAGFHRPRGLAVADDVVDLGLAENLVDRDAELAARPIDHRDADRFAAAHDRAQLEIELALRCGE